MKRLLTILLMLGGLAFGQSYSLSPAGKLQFLDSTGAPLAGGKVYTYQAGTTTAVSTYSDNAGTLNANPIVLDSAGRATIYLKSNVAYKFVVQDSTGAAQWTQDNIYTLASLVSVTFASAGTLQADITAACNGTTPGNVLLPGGTVAVTSTLTIPSNCNVYGYGKYSTTLQGSGAGMDSAPILLLSSVSNVQLHDFTVDGNRPTLSNATGIKFVSSSHVTLENMLVTNCIGSALFINTGNTYLTFDQVEASKSGAALPTSTGGGFIIDPVANTSGNSYIRITNSSSHDNNIGISLYPDAGSDVSKDLEVSNSRIYANADDGIQIDSVGRTGTIIGPRIVNSDIECNGWPANGTGFPANCTAGFLQSGSSASASNVGIDLIGGGVTRAVLVGNHTHDNVGDGISFDGRTSSTVNTSGTSVTKTAGDSFNTNWRANEAVIINGTTYLLASVASSTSATLSTSAGTQTGVAFAGPSLTAATITGNQSYNDGVGTTGAGFFNYWADGNTYSGNLSQFAALAGFQCQGSAHITYSGDQAYSNGRSGTFTTGFESNTCLEPQYFSIATDDPQSSPTQVTGVTLDSQTNGARVDSTAVHGSTAAVADTGSGNLINVPDYLGSMPGSGTSSNSDGNGAITLNAGSGSYTFVGKYASAPSCVCSSTNAANSCGAATTTTTLTLTGTGTDVVLYMCRKKN